MLLRDSRLLYWHEGREDLRLTRDRINTKGGYINLPPQDTKTGEARHVSFNGANQLQAFKPFPENLARPFPIEGGFLRCFASPPMMLYFGIG